MFIWFVFKKQKFNVYTCIYIYIDLNMCLSLVTYKYTIDLNLSPITPSLTTKMETCSVPSVQCS